MARFTRIQITDLCKALENDAHTVLSVHPAASGRIKTAVMLLRLTTQLADIQEVETTAEIFALPVVRKQ